MKLPGESPDHMLFTFTERTDADVVPCASAQCWVKPPGEPLQFCGRDCCAYAAAVACKQEHLTARPDRRRRQHAEAGAEPVVGGLAALNAWRTRWHVVRANLDVGQDEDGA